MGLAGAGSGVDAVAALLRFLDFGFAFNFALPVPHVNAGTILAPDPAGLPTLRLPPLSLNAVSVFAFMPLGTSISPLCNAIANTCLQQKFSWKCMQSHSYLHTGWDQKLE